MVGIPGRSGGCHTCRRRKIKCDQTRPYCLRCTKFDRKCEGYETYSIFLNRTQQGAQHRKHLEEARPSNTENSYDTEASSNDSIRSNVSIKQYTENLCPIASLRAQVDSNIVEDRQILSLLLQNYYSTSLETANCLSTRHWLEIVAEFSDMGPALSAALRALSYGRVGVTYGDQKLIYKGKEFYAAALSEVKKVLHSSSDTTLAACKALSMYELFIEAVGDNPLTRAGHHQRGLEMLIYRRGPHKKSSELFECLLENARESSISLALLEGGYSYFERPEWKSNRTDLGSRMLDMGAKLANLHHDVAKARDAGHMSPIFVKAFLDRCLEIGKCLEIWWKDFQVSCPSPLYWEDRSLSLETCRFEPVPLSFSTYYEADLTTKYWTGIILISWIPKILNDALQQHKQKYDGLYDSIYLDPIQEVYIILSRPDLREVAKKIFRSVPYFLQPKMGLYGTNRVSFAFRTALSVYHTEEYLIDENEQQWVSDLTDCFVQGMKIPLVKIQGSWFPKIPYL